MSLVTRNNKNETVVNKAAFRCKKCGTLVSSDHAGERDYPMKCAICKAGVIPAMSLIALQQDRPELFKGLTGEDLRDVKQGGRVGALPFDMIYFVDHSNWEVLADKTPTELAAIDHALKPEHIERHVPFKSVWKDGVHTKIPHDGQHGVGESIAYARGLEDATVTNSKDATIVK